MQSPQQLPLISIKNASLFLPGDKQRKLVLQNINLELFPRRHLSIYGPNGAGKTTLLRLMHGELPLQGGSIGWCQGEVLDSSRITGQEITGLVSPQIQVDCQLYAQGLTGREFLLQAGINTGIEHLARRLASTNILGMLLAHMSQGQLRLLLLMREILRRPAVLLLDEWAEGLDQQKRRLMHELLADLAHSMTIVCASHREADIPAFIAGRRHLLNGRFTSAAEMELSELAVSKPAAPAVAASRLTAGTIIFELTRVNVYKDRELLLQDINWRMKAGEHWRVTGANGSGKSTLLRLLAGEEFAAAGGIFRHFSPALGREIITLDERKRAAPLVSDLHQALYGYPVSALELVLTGIDMAEGIHREYGPEEREEARARLKHFLPDIEPERSIRQLSTGQLRRLFLARALMGRPDVLLLDEPCTGLDAESRSRFIDLVFRLASGAAGYPLQLVLVSHNESDFSALPFRVAHMDEGKLIIN